MHFPACLIAALALATTSVSGAAISQRDSSISCRSKNFDDSIGKSCTYANSDSFTNASNQYCGLYSFAQTIPEGQSTPLKIAGNDDGFGTGTKQIFWGNYRIDRGGSHTITVTECQGYMLQIYNQCGGFGGWIDTDFGTVFGECIKS